MSAAPDLRSLTLSAHELQDITGYKRGREQYDYLIRNGWHVQWNERAHRPIVHRLWYEAFVTGAPAANMSKPKFELVNNGRTKN